MLLTLDGAPRAFVPLRAFRAEYELPNDFGIGMFLTKDYTGRGSILRAGEALRQLHQTIVNAIPDHPATTWTMEALNLQGCFRRELMRCNDRIGLHAREIDFAAMGFGEICQAFIYALLRSKIENEAPPYFPHLYMEWLNSTIARSTTMYPYLYRGQVWHIQIVRTAFGRAGMLVHTPDETHYVQDSADACPAEDFMIRLLEDVTGTFAAVILQSAPAEAICSVS